MGGLKPVRVGNVLFVTSKANAKEIKADLEQPTPPGVPPVQYEFQLRQQRQLQLLFRDNAVPQPAPPAVVPIDVLPVPTPPVEKDGEKKDDK
jgi:hypothetical protein